MTHCQLIGAQLLVQLLVFTTKDSLLFTKEPLATEALLIAHCAIKIQSRRHTKKQGSHISLEYLKSEI